MAAISDRPEHCEGFWNETITQECSFCGRPSTAFWTGKSGTIEVCPKCAETVLVSLIVDSIRSPEYRTTVERLLEKVRTRFWYALADRLAKIVQIAPKESELTQD